MRLPEYAARALCRLENAGFEAWAVGGCVRDSLRGAEPHDFDLCTAARPRPPRAKRPPALRHGLYVWSLL